MKKPLLILLVVGVVAAGAIPFHRWMSSAEHKQYVEKRNVEIKEAVRRFMAGEAVDSTSFPWHLSDGRVDFSLLRWYMGQGVVSEAEYLRLYSPHVLWKMEKSAATTSSEIKQSTERIP